MSHRQNFLKYDVFFLFLRVVLIYANSAEPDESGSSLFAKVPV